MSFAQRYHEFILWIGAVTGQNDTVLHIHAGLAILVLTRIVSGRSFGTFIPFAVVLAAELANEALDRLALGAWLPAETAMDLANTLFWPFAISLGVRWRPMILRDRRSLGPERRRSHGRR